MVGLDLDGTLLNSQKKLSSYTRKVLEKAIAEGVVIVIATGRPFFGIPEEMKCFSGIRYALTANGARILDIETKKVLCENFLSVDKAETVLDILKKHHAIHEIFVDGGGYMNEDGLNNIHTYFQDPHMTEYFQSTRVPVKDVKEQLWKMNCSVDKLQGIFLSREDREAAKKELELLAGVTVTSAMDNNLEINREGTNKGIGLLRLGKLLGISREEIMACGDGGNDVDMLKEVGFAVAMENGIEGVKAVADYVTTTNDDDGVAKAFEQFVLTGGGKKLC